VITDIGLSASQLTKNFIYRDKHVYIKLYKQYVRPHLEFASPAWSPWQAGDIEILEKVQEKAIRQIVGLKGKTYTERCRELDLETLAKRRFMQDMSQTFKIVKNMDKIDRDKVFLQQRDEGARTRAGANPWNIKKKFAHTETRLNSFGLRVVDGCGTHCQMRSKKSRDCQSSRKNSGKLYSKAN
jgi:hypothetical protein